MASPRKVGVLGLCLVSNLVLAAAVGFCTLPLLRHAYDRCSEGKGSMSALNRQIHATGQDVVQVFNTFCAATPIIHQCAHMFLHNFRCSAVDKAFFDEMTVVSEWFCDGSTVKEEISDMYKDIPAVGTRSSEDPCMSLALKGKLRCYYETMHVLLSENVEDEKVTHRRIVGSILCGIKSFENEDCPVRRSVLTTTLAYAESLVPPSLGVNITETLLLLDNHLQNLASRNMTH